MSTFGYEVSCTDSLRTGRFVSGTRLVAEACYRRLITPRGMLRGGENEDDYGFDLTTMVGQVSTKAQAAALPQRIQTELLKDERLQSVDVVVTPTKDSAGAVSFNVEITGHTAEGPFSLVLSVSQVTTQLLGITT